MVAREEKWKKKKGKPLELFAVASIILTHLAKSSLFFLPPPLRQCHLQHFVSFPLSKRNRDYCHLVVWRIVSCHTDVERISLLAVRCSCCGVFKCSLWPGHRWHVATQQLASSPLALWCQFGVSRPLDIPVEMSKVLPLPRLLLHMETQNTVQRWQCWVWAFNSKLTEVCKWMISADQHNQLSNTKKPWATSCIFHRTLSLVTLSSYTCRGQKQCSYHITHSCRLSLCEGSHGELI